ncbi:hypothetical protein B0J13DRAFT_459875 [Dactylonectria estremocensis]|uniref:Uncharacterized protein n=1 Tax=Dactylonectria estremocensis TaxID=1079267 RepID=A0A9P9D822_9HYPO|nr:hypothetical protein B0J13DRAFT_459875 [Dactylonectria estremocensis]
MSASTRHSNAERRRERDECRTKLSQHINDRLGISVKPFNVRLNPRPNGLYSWRILPGQEHELSRIFKKNPSEHSISIFRMLSKRVGITFEAVSAEASDLIPGSLISIEKLQDTKYSLSQQAFNLNNSLEMELHHRELAETEAKQLQEKLSSLEEQVQIYSTTADYLQNVVSQCYTALNTTLPILEGLQKFTSRNPNHITSDIQTGPPSDPGGP